MPVVLDCSVAMSWYFEENSPELADAYLRIALSEGVVVPALWPFEILNAVLSAERRRKSTRVCSDKFLSLLGQLNAEIESPPVGSSCSQIIDIAQTHQLTAYDAAYLELAIRRKLPLLSCDAALLRAAERTGTIIRTPTINT